MTICPACSGENPDAAKFCAHCGRPVGVAVCPGCGTPVQPQARFCIECGTPLAGVPAPAESREPAGALQGERKHITVLFADVAGSMDLQERLDAEVWAQIMGRFVGILVEGVRRFGGTIDKFTGDGIMALFGAPQAQEDHARRACHAAWHLTKAIGEYAAGLRRQDSVELQVRLGMNSGEVVVGRVGDDTGLDPTALGHTVGLAQRMEAMAEPGRAYLTEHTARLVEGWFRLEDLGARPVKGVARPVGVYALAAPLSAPARATTGAAPLVGRERELAVLADALALAREGQAQVVGVVGEAGVGKSRLCEEFARFALAEGVTVSRTAGVSHGRDVPLLPILAFQREYFGISDTDDPEAARRKVSDRLLGLDPGLEDALPLLLDFLEVPDPNRPAPPMGAEIRMRRILETVRRITARRSQRQALVLIFEDLHWFDPQSRSFLEQLIESYPGSRTLVVANFRPEFAADWMRHSYYRQLALAPLGQEAVGELLVRLLGTDPSLEPLVGIVRDRTGGNPLFVEEVIRSLLEDGTVTGEAGGYRLSRRPDEVKVPPRVQAVLAGRIDRLPAPQKELLQTASVIGRTFARPVLARVAGLTEEELGPLLRGLSRAELVQEMGDGAEGSDYRFWHPLTQEVAAGSLLGGRRRALHGAVARALMETQPERLDENAALIAAHFEAGGETTETSRWQMRAARWALRTNVGEAQRRWRSVITELDAGPPTPETLRLEMQARSLLLRLGARTGMDPVEAQRLLETTRQKAQRLDDPALLMLATFAEGSVKFWQGDVSGALECYVATTELAGAAGDRGLSALGWTALSVIRPYTGPIPEGIRAADTALELCGDDPLVGADHAGFSAHDVAGFARAHLLTFAGRLTEARQAVDAALGWFGIRPLAEYRSWSLSLIPRLSDLTGEPEDTTSVAEEALRLADDSGNPAAKVSALLGAGVGHLVVADSDSALRSLEEALRIGRERRSGRFEEAATLAQVARAYLQQADPGRALEAAGQSVATARRQGAAVAESFALLVRGRVRRTAGDVPAAAADLAAGLALARRSGAATYEPFLREELGRLRADEEELTSALRLYEQIGATGHARRLRRELSGETSR